MHLGQYYTWPHQLHMYTNLGLGTRPSKNQKGGPGKQGRVEVYTAEC